MPADEATVVYGLGVLLVCLLTRTAERNIRFLDERAEPNEHMARSALRLGCKDALSAVRRRSAAAGRIVDAAWKGETTVDEFVRLL